MKYNCKKCVFYDFTTKSNCFLFENGKNCIYLKRSNRISSITIQSDKLILIYESGDITMIKYENECVGCPTEMGCMGSGCPNRNVPHSICEHCKNEDVKLYEFDGQQLCIECVKKGLEVVEGTEDFED